MHGQQRTPQLPAARAATRPASLRRNRKSALLGHDAHRLGEAAFLHLHHEAKHISTGAAPETVIDLLDRMDREGRCFFLMERAQPQIVLPALLQPHILADDADNVRLLLDAIGERSGLGHCGCSIARALRS